MQVPVLIVTGESAKLSFLDVANKGQTASAED